MITTAETAAWTWDARPFPAFPARSDVWTDADNWRLGHWLNGRLGSVSLGSLVRELCRRAGLPDSQIDVSALADVVHGYLITALESPRASIAPLARHFGFDAVESEGVIRFQPRDRRPAATLTLDDLVAGSDADAEVIELVRAQETELPQALKWQLVRADEEYDAMSVEARRATGAALQGDLRDLRHRHAGGGRRAPLPPGAARGVGRPRDRVVPAAAIAARARSRRRGPARPRRSARGPAADQRRRRRTRGRSRRCAPTPAPTAWRRARTAARGCRSRSSTGRRRWRSSTCRSSARAPLRINRSPLRMRCPGRDASPPGPVRARTASRWRRPSAGRRGWAGWSRRSIAGPTSRFDLGNVAIVDLAYGTLASVTDLALFAGANALAVEAAPGVWEVLQAGVAELIAPGRYRLSRLLRGQRGTEGAIGSPAPAGARVVVLDEALAPLPIPEAALGLEANWRFGPASKPVADRSYRQLALHAEGRRPAAVLGRPCTAAVADGARARRSRDRLDPPLAGAGGRQLDRRRGAARRGARGLRGRGP